MAKKPIQVSVDKEIQAIRKATRQAVAAGLQGRRIIGNLKSKRKTAQFTFDGKSDKDNRSLIRIAERKILDIAFRDKAPLIEIAIKKALIDVVASMVGVRNKGIVVLGRSLGNANPSRQISDAPFANFIRSQKGAGEVGLPDPEKSLRDLEIALTKAITVDVVVRQDGPQVIFTFDQSRLLRLTPHPSRLEPGSSQAIGSWLMLVTGPKMIRSTPGFALVTVRDLISKLTSSKSFVSGAGIKSKRNRQDITAGLIRASRTRGNAGQFAAIMLRNEFTGGTAIGGRSTAEAFGGVTEEYKPSRQFAGFWDEWWLRTKLDLSIWSRRVMRAAVRQILQR